ncbi:hypothetical protein [Aquimarina algiphila]|uniref:hypothetical protein n=1 Tax=Aquimarina algiphila TaxID=2047982 RepID=UPI00232F7282|nr:hypothetical protein [Aquimarina algiphila]
MDKSMIKNKLTNNYLENRYLMNNVGVGIERALEMKEILQNKEIFDKLISYQKELYQLEDPSISNPKSVKLTEQRKANSIGIEVFNLIQDYLQD